MQKCLSPFFIFAVFDVSLFIQSFIYLLNKSVKSAVKCTVEQDSCPEIKTTQKLYIKQKLKSRIISAITQTQDTPKNQ